MLIASVGKMAWDLVHPAEHRCLYSPQIPFSSSPGLTSIFFVMQWHAGACCWCWAFIKLIHFWKELLPGTLLGVSLFMVGSILIFHVSEVDTALANQIIWQILTNQVLIVGRYSIRNRYSLSLMHNSLCFLLYRRSTQDFMHCWGHSQFTLHMASCVWWLTSSSELFLIVIHSRCQTKVSSTHWAEVTTWGPWLWPVVNTLLSVYTKKLYVCSQKSCALTLWTWPSFTVWGPWMPPSSHWWRCSDKGGSEPVKPSLLLCAEAWTSIDDHVQLYSFLLSP